MAGRAKKAAAKKGARKKAPEKKVNTRKERGIVRVGSGRPPIIRNCPFCTLTGPTMTVRIHVKDKHSDYRWLVGQVKA